MSDLSSRFSFAKRLQVFRNVSYARSDDEACFYGRSLKWHCSWAWPNRFVYVTCSTLAYWLTPAAWLQTPAANLDHLQFDWDFSPVEAGFQQLHGTYDDFFGASSDLRISLDQLWMAFVFRSHATGHCLRASGRVKERSGLERGKLKSILQIIFDI